MPVDRKILPLDNREVAYWYEWFNMLWGGDSQIWYRWKA